MKQFATSLIAIAFFANNAVALLIAKSNDYSVETKVVKVEVEEKSDTKSELVEVLPKFLATTAEIALELVKEEAKESAKIDEADEDVEILELEDEEDEEEKEQGVVH